MSILLEVLVVTELISDEDLPSNRKSWNLETELFSKDINIQGSIGCKLEANHHYK